MIVSVTLNPSVDQTIYVDGLKPHDTNRILRIETDAGGKGVNVSRIVSALGGKTVATGFVGGSAGSFVKGALDEMGVPHRFVRLLEDTRTNYSIEDGSGSAPTTLNAQGPDVDDRRWSELRGVVEVLSPGASWVALGGSLPPGVPIDAYRTLCETARNGGGKVALDADGEAARKGLEAKPDLIKPNGKEAGRLLERSIETLDQAVLAAKELRQYLAPDGICIVSLGERGAVMACKGSTVAGRAIAVEARSTVGSGDSMVGAVLLALERGLPPGECLRYGLAAGAATAMTDGTTIADRETVEELLPLALVEAVH